MSEASARAPLRGLVLAGGESRRMGRDKGTLAPTGEPLVRRAYGLLSCLCAEVSVSVRPAQVRDPLYADLPLVVDDGSVAGPAAGLLAAWAAAPGDALCVLAVDLPRVDAALLGRLVAARDPAAVATAFAHADGTLEPLCTIWEPAARAELVAPEPGAGISLRRVLEHSRVHVVEAPEPERLESVNTPDELARIGG